MTGIKINNHRKAPLILRRKDAAAKSILIRSAAATTGQVIIPPGASGHCDFWDEIKSNPVYVNWLDRGLISVGDGDDPVPGGSVAFTSFGDTLEPPPNLKQNDPEVEVMRDNTTAGALADDPGQTAITGKRRARKRSAAEGAQTENNR